MATVKRRLSNSAKAINAAMRLMDKEFAKYESDMLLAYNPSDDDADKCASLTVLICTKENSDHRPGTVEYNVGDGLPGKRSWTHDFLDFKEALAFYNKIVQTGWQAYLNRAGNVK